MGINNEAGIIAQVQNMEYDINDNNVPAPKNMPKVSKNIIPPLQLMNVHSRIGTVIVFVRSYVRFTVKKTQ